MKTINNLSDQDKFNIGFRLMSKVFIHFSKRKNSLLLKATWFRWQREEARKYLKNKTQLNNRRKKQNAT